MSKFLLKTASYFLLFCFLVSTFVFNPQQVESAAQFSTGYDIHFNFEENGQTRVTQKISLTNLTANFYASEYSLTIGSEKVSNVSGSDGLGAINIATKTQTGQTSLVATLNQKIVGQNKTVSFQINYTIDSLAIKRGRIWEINIPHIVTSENVSSYKLVVSTPSSYGKLGKMSPNPESTEPTAGRTNYIFSKNTVGTSGIGASFGDYQQFKFTLKYRYKNSNLYTAKATIALPPDTEYQAVLYKNLDPKPSSIQVDENGNYLATYLVKSGKNLEVIASGYARIVDGESPFQKPTDWTKTDLKKFTQSDRYVEVQKEQIQKKAKELKDIKEIYDFVSKNLKYDYSRLENNNLGRRGALEALNRPDQSICTDFTDLFVALARAKGIPARGLVGYGYTDNTNLRPTRVEGIVDTTVLHAWPEYYDKEKNRWIQVDPTWGSTTGGVDYLNRLDTNHFVFVVNGTSSQNPLPAGAYKTSENQIDDVKVEFSDENVNFEPDFNLNLKAGKVISGFPSTSELILENKTGRAVFESTIKINKTGTLGVVDPNEIESGILLPFENKTFKVRLRSNSLLDNSTEIVTIQFSGMNRDTTLEKEIEKNVIVKPFFSLDIPQIALLIIFLLVVASWIYPIIINRRKINT